MRKHVFVHKAKEQKHNPFIFGSAHIDGTYDSNPHLKNNQNHFPSVVLGVVDARTAITTATTTLLLHDDHEAEFHEGAHTVMEELRRQREEIASGDDGVATFWPRAEAQAQEAETWSTVCGF